MTTFTIKYSDVLKESSIIHNVYYDEDEESLRITFHDKNKNEKDTYIYFDVSRNVIDKWMKAKSIGSYFVKHIKNGGYKFEKLELDVL